MFSSPLTLIDCGASHTAVGVFRRSGGRLRLERCAIERFALLAAAEDDWLRQTTTALRELGRRVRPAGRVVCVLPPHLTLTKHVRAPRVGAAKRAKIVRFEAEQAIPYNLAEVAWDSCAAGETAAELDVMLAAVKLDVVSALGAAASAAGFEPTAMLPSSLATLGALRLLRPGLAEPALVLNCGARSTAILQVEAGRFGSRVVPVGGQALGRAPADGTVESLATRLTQEIARSVLHFERHGGLSRPVRLILTGETARSTDLAAALGAHVKLPVELLSAGDAVQIAPAARSEAATAGSALVDLAGAAARLVAPVPVVNLLPPRLRRQAGIRRRRGWLMAAAALAVLVPVPPILHFHGLAAAARGKTAAIEAATMPVRERAARNRAALEEVAALRAEVAQLHDLAARRTAWVGLFADLQDRLVQVEDVWFERLQTIPAGGGGPLKLAISGRMLDKTNPLAKVSPETYARVQSLLAELAGSPYVAAVEGERFDNSQPGILKFDFVLVTEAARPL